MNFSTDKKPTEPGQYWASSSHTGATPFVASVHATVVKDIDGPTELSVQLVNNWCAVDAINWLWGDKVEFPSASPPVEAGLPDPDCKMCNGGGVLYEGGDRSRASMECPQCVEKFRPLSIAEAEDLIRAVNIVMNPVSSEKFFPKGWNILLEKLKMIQDVTTRARLLGATGMGEAAEILFAYGEDNEATADPFWAIVSNSAFGQMVFKYGPFFSRASAQDCLDSGRHRYGEKAYVFCFSGSMEYRRLRAALRPRLPAAPNQKQKTKDE